MPKGKNCIPPVRQIIEEAHDESEDAQERIFFEKLREKWEKYKIKINMPVRDGMPIFFSETPYGYDSFGRAAIERTYAQEFIKWALSIGGNINIVDKRKYNLLMYLMYYIPNLDSKAVEFLIEIGSKVDLIDANGKSSLDIAQLRLDKEKGRWESKEEYTKRRDNDLRIRGIIREALGLCAGAEPCYNCVRMDSTLPSPKKGSRYYLCPPCREKLLGITKHK